MLASASKGVFEDITITHIRLSCTTWYWSGRIPATHACARCGVVVAECPPARLDCTMSTSTPGLSRAHDGGARGRAGTRRRRRQRRPRRTAWRRWRPPRQGRRGSCRRPECSRCPICRTRLCDGVGGRGQPVRVQVFDGDQAEQNRGQSARSDPAEEQHLAGAETGAYEGEYHREH